MRASTHTEGTFHQSQLVGRDARRGFFSPPDAALAEAVNQDADTVEFTEAEEASYLLRGPSIVRTAHLARRRHRKRYATRLTCVYSRSSSQGQPRSAIGERVAITDVRMTPAGTAISVRASQRNIRGNGTHISK